MIDEEDLLPEKQIDETLEEPAFSFATVEEVGASGITLILDGTEESGGKSYPCNAALLFRPGDRVKVHKDSGTYVVEFPLGAPGSRYPIPAGGAKGKVLAKHSAADYDLEWGDPGGLPAGGAKGKVLKKKSATDYDAEWGDVDGGLPSGGAKGTVLRKKSATDGDVEWAEPEVAKLAASSAVAVQIGTNGVIQSINTTQPSLGSSTYGKQFKDVYTSGGTLSFGASKLGFFGTTPIARKSLSTSATLAQLIQALKDYGLFS